MDNIAQLVDFDLTVRMPLAFGGGTVYAQVLDQLQTLLADLTTRLKGFFAVALSKAF